MKAKITLYKIISCLVCNSYRVVETTPDDLTSGFEICTSCKEKLKTQKDAPSNIQKQIISS